ILKPYFVLALLIILCVTTKEVSAQKGAIKGVITANSEAAPYIMVTLKGTDFGAVTDTSGKFFITNIPSGEYQVILNGIGYGKSAEKIKVIAGETTYYNKTL